MYNRYSHIQLLGYGCVSSSLSAVVNAVRNGRWQLITVNAINGWSCFPRQQPYPTRLAFYTTDKDRVKHAPCVLCSTFSMTLSLARSLSRAVSFLSPSLPPSSPTPLFLCVLLCLVVCVRLSVALSRNLCALSSPPPPLLPLFRPLSSPCLLCLFMSMSPFLPCLICVSVWSLPLF